MLRLTWNKKRYKEGDLTDKEFQRLRECAFANKGRATFVSFLRDGYVSVMVAKYRRNKQLLIDEAVRYYNTGQVYCHPFIYSSMGCYFVCMDDTDLDHTRLSYWGCKRFVDDYSMDNIRDGLFDTDGNFTSLCHAYHGYSNKELMAWLRRYCAYLKPKDENHFAYCVSNPAWVVKRYNEGLPSSELFIKAGFYDFAFNKSMTKLKDKKKRTALYNFVNKNPNCYHNYSPSVVYMMAMKGWTYEQYLDFRQKAYIKGFLKANFNEELANQIEDIYKYMEKLGFSPITFRYSPYGGFSYNTDRKAELWIDYLKECKANGIAVENYNIWHPRWLTQTIGDSKKDVHELIRRHTDTMYRKRREREEAKRQAEMKKKKASMEVKISKFAKIIGDFEKDNVRFHTFNCLDDFIKVGNAMKNCVGTCGYDEKMAERKTFCFSVYVDDKLTLCGEADVKNKTIKQLYGANNRKDNVKNYDRLYDMSLDFIASRRFRNARTVAA